MRREKPLPKESSFKEFSTNRVKKPKTRTKKLKFQIKDKKYNKIDTKSNDCRSSNFKSRNVNKRDGVRRYSENSSKGIIKHDRRSSRGKSFKESNRDLRKNWNSVSKNMRGIERRSRGKIEMFDAVCKKCGKDCQVPFKPQMSKGVSCRDCFQKNATDNYRISGGARFSQKRESNQRFAKTYSGVRELFDAVCMKCKKPCKVPFKPTGKMGVSCSNCFVKKERPSDRRKNNGRGSFVRGRPNNRVRR